MALSLDEVHLELVKACLCGDINQIYQLSYYNKSHVEKLIKGDVLHVHKTKYGTYKPGDYLYIACEKGHHELVNVLVQLGSSIDTGFSDDSTTPLLIASRKGFVEVLKCLKESGAVIHSDDTDFKDTPIFQACLSGHINMLEYITSEYQDVLIRKVNGSIGQTPNLDYIHIWSGLATMLKTDAGILIGNFLLFVACMNGHLGIVKYLVDKGVSVNHLSAINTFYSASTTPLSVACRQNDYELAFYLMQQKAEITESIVDQYTEFTSNLLFRKRKRFHQSSSLGSIADFKKSIDRPISMLWDSLNLFKIHRYWLESCNESICLIDIHLNHLSELPNNFFVLLPNLIELDASCNQLKHLPFQGLLDSKIRKMMICKNKIKYLPLELFRNHSIEKIDVSQNDLQFLPNEIIHEDGSVIQWDCPSLKYLKCSMNVLLSIPQAIVGATGLEKLFCSNNMMSVFETTWRCPLNELDLSFNQLTEFTSMSQMVWSKTLQRLNLSHNNLKVICSNVCHLINLQVLNLSHNEMQTLPPPTLWKCKILCKLNLSHNQITASTGTTDFDGMELINAIDCTDDIKYTTTCEFPVSLFSDSLHVLDLSFNCLENVPKSVCLLVNLTELDLSNNPPLRFLPAQLGNLKNIWNLKLSNLDIPSLPYKLDDRSQSKTVLGYLRQKLRKSVPFNRMKLMVVGLQARGKTTLIATLQEKRPPPDMSTVGIVVEEWNLNLTASKSFTSLLNWNSNPNQKDGIIFSCWDLAGQHVYYSTHQCFLTRKTLYLVVFNVTHGKEGVESLGPWLLNIQARAPNSKVIIVGTHIDGLPNSSKRTVLNRMEADIMQNYDKKGFPMLSGCGFVSNISGEGLPRLREKIYDLAHVMNEKDLVGVQNVKQAPLSYIQLYDSIIKEAQIRKINNEPPILTTYELLELAKKNNDNDIYDTEELIKAASFLHENGVLLHFNDQLRELNTLFFIDPPWLCDMLSLVVTVRERNPFVINGYINRDDLNLILKNPRLPEKFIPQYLQLLERFEIVLTLDNKMLLIPSMLPKDRPEDLLAKVKQRCPEVTTQTEDISSKFLIRNYHMNYVPSGFWSRLIARLSIAVHKWGVTVSIDNNDKNVSNEMQYSLVLWRDGILVIYDEGYFLVESFIDDIQYDEYSNRGVSITVWSMFSDFSVMGFIVDHLDTLIEEWYPGLEDVDEFGIPLVLKYIPCPVCIKQHQINENMETIACGNLKENYSVCFRDENFVHQFDLQVCALASLNYRCISCKKHTSHPVPLELVVPELLLSDLPSCYVIHNDYFEFNPCEDTRLGEGGAGGVYCGKYNGENVAVKQFHSSKKKHGLDTLSADSSNDTGDKRVEKSTFVPVDQTIVEQIEDGKVMRAFWELRQEVAVLCRLQHANIVRFIGVCLSPLCFALELAPLGSLQSILEKLSVEREIEIKALSTSNLRFPAILGRILTCKMALQVARAIEYLHDSEIIYRDLKSDNILVFSMEDDAVTNVKISDYGISTFATPQGVLGEGGTPGFQAPEVKIGCAYDEKVDIFSYGIWLYEIMSGFRPFREYRTASEMKRAVARGCRPALAKDGITPNLPTLESLMEECWDSNPVIRPTSSELTKSLESIDTFIIENIYPKPPLRKLENVTCVYPWIDSETQSMVVSWSGHGKYRQYQLVDIAKSNVVDDVLCPGPRVLCALQVNDYLWLGTEGREKVCHIEVFGKIMTSISSVLWNIELKDPVMALRLYKLKENGNERVFASLANGTLIVLTKSFDEKNKYSTPLFDQERQDVIAYEKDLWSNMIEINLAIQGLPAKCMCITTIDNNNELWVGSGNMIVIINPDSLNILTRIQALKTTRSLVSSLVTNNKYVWSADWKNASVIQWCVNTKTKLYTLKCNIENPLGKNLIVSNANYGLRVLSEDDRPFLSGHYDNFDPFKNDVTNNLNDSVITVVDDNTYSMGKNTDDILLNSPSPSASVLSDSIGDSPKSINLDQLHSDNNGTTTDNKINEDLPKSSRLVARYKNHPKTGKVRSLSECLSPVETAQNESCAEKNIIKESELIKKISIRRQPSLLSFKKSKKKSSPLRDQLNRRANNTRDSGNFPRPRSCVITGNFECVTSMFYLNDMLWIGRSSGDVLIVDVSEEIKNVNCAKEFVEKQPTVGTFEKQCTVSTVHKPSVGTVIKQPSVETVEKQCIVGTVINILCTDIKVQTNCVKTMTNIFKMNSTNKLLLTLRLDPKSERLHSISSRIKVKENLYSDSHFQLILLDSWSRDRVNTFNLDINSKSKFSGGFTSGDQN